MAKEITISIDNRAVHTLEGTSILEAADRAGVYIPRLCYHPDLPPGPGTKTETRVCRNGEISAEVNSHDAVYHGCNICIVEIEGKGPSPSCATVAQDGMVIHSDSAAVRELRRENLARILSLHPHACLLCAQKEGCDREACSQGLPKNERCCQEFDECELRKISEYVTIRDNVSKYSHRNIPIADTPLFTVNHNLCIGCARCVRACEKTNGRKVIGFVYRNGEFHLGTLNSSYQESGCAFCGACVEVCPTGARRDKGLPWKKKSKLDFAPVILPPENDLALTEENINNVPETSGVFQLIDQNREIIYIRGADNIRKDLQGKWQSVENARFFRYEEHGMYTMRETEMLEKFLKKNGKLPEVNDEISDLY